jgi:hypothetical protein
MNRLRFTLLSSSVLLTLAAVACGGIADPTKGGEGRVATVSGALTGIAVPANARVALVYRKVTATMGSATTAVVEVGSDAPVVNGKFSMSLGVPSAEYFSGVDGYSISRSVGSPPPLADAPVPEGSPNVSPPSSGGSTSGGGAAFSPRLSPRDTAVGGQITEPMTAALAGFVVYADTNGNGKLDLEGQYANSPDQILGGNKELMLVYLKDGGALDYEKMRDKSGILPAAGFNLAWTEGRWLPLNVVELKLSAKAQLPSSVCNSYSGYDSVSSSSGSVGTADPLPPTVSVDGGSNGGSSSSGGSSGGSSGSSAGYAGYPSPTDPGLHCSPDGRSFTYSAPASECPPSPPPPVGLCAGDVYETTACAGPGYGYGTSLSSDQPVPAGWPCPVAGGLDGGAADASASDAGSADGGS